MVKEVVFKSPAPYKQSSNTPIEQQKEFSPTWCEFAAQKYPQIVMSGGSGNLYIVPQTSFLFITTAWISGENNNGSGTAKIRVLDRTGTIEIYSLVGVRVGSDAAATARANSSNSIPFPMPIKVNANSIIDIQIQNISAILGGFSGFLVPFVA